MRFEDYWLQIKELGVLPTVAAVYLPNSLSNSVKRKMMRIEPNESARMIPESIDEIHSGSIETIDSL